MSSPNSFTLKEVGFGNLAYVDELHERWRKDSKSVATSWDQIFSRFPNGVKADEPSVRSLRLIEAYRLYGHLKAKSSPIHSPLMETPRQLAGFQEIDLSKSCPTFGLLPESQAPLSDLIERLETIYCGSVGVEYVGLVEPEVEEWLRSRIEAQGFHPLISVETKREILHHLNRSELFETFLHTRYPGQKRFSLEGGETLLPLLSFLIDEGADLGGDEFWIGMSHRGRLNVLCNILGKTYRDVFSEFKEGYIPRMGEGSGDVKYHKGFYSKVKSNSGKDIEVIVASNPSHLESVGPVILGKVRARQEKLDSVSKAVPILIHGDASLAGQGVVYETMQFCRLPGYQTGGTLHVVINNEIGFTTLPQEGRSTTYCTDVAKTFGAPIFHVNAEDPEAACFVARLAAELRQRFSIDVFIDLVCYRKYGHNESDEPSFTQPLEYQKIRSKKSPRQIYRSHLIVEGHLEEKLAQELEDEFRASLDEAHEAAKQVDDQSPELPKCNREVKTAVSEDALIGLAQKLAEIPPDFNAHKKISQLYQERVNMVTTGSIDWGMGETLAYATLLDEGHHVRIAGQDVGRGTFSHRQALLVDQITGSWHLPLSRLGSFQIFNSPLSEFASLGFEFGYSAQYKEALVIWEAQFGDFANGAQVVIDQYISTSEDKWGQRNGLVLLLPHGYEGQGPEHSSARIERFLSLCGKENMQVCHPTLPSQLFHLLRRQVLGDIEKPLIVFTPKVLLRHPLCRSKLEEFSEGHFLPILDDPKPPKSVKKLVLCSGKVFYDLFEKREEVGGDIALVRIEELYPFPEKELEDILEKYGAEEVIWAQEEPQNMGPWWYMRQLWRWGEIKVISRSSSASPAVGSLTLHKQEQAKIYEQLFG